MVGAAPPDGVDEGAAKVGCVTWLGVMLRVEDFGRHG